MKLAAFASAAALALITAGPASADRHANKVAVTLTPIIQDVFDHLSAKAVEQVPHIIMLSAGDAARACTGHITGSRCVASRITRPLLIEADRNLQKGSDGGV